MKHIWLHSNRRVLVLAMVPVAFLGLLGAVFCGMESLPWNRGIGIFLVVLAGILGIGLIHQYRQPRISYQDGSVLFYLQAGPPITVPIHVVEAFFLGSGPAHLPIDGEANTRSTNLIARLSRREPEWHERDVKSALGDWTDGYVTIRGTWCEPITEELLAKLNTRLHKISTEYDSTANSHG